MQHPITTAVFPVGGLGTRFLPATKVTPKEMLPVVDKPIIQYAIEEAQAAGITKFVLVSARGKGAMEDHFDQANELCSWLRARGKDAEAVAIEAQTPPEGSVITVRQGAPHGLGHAVWCARDVIGAAPFAVILPDDMVMANTPCLKQMVDAYQSLTVKGNMASVMEVPLEHTSRYGILSLAERTDLPANLVEATGLVEKPKPENAPSRMSIIGRYILQPHIMQVLDAKQRGAGGEIQLTDAMHRMMDMPDMPTPFYGFLFEGTRYDCGDKAGFVAANVAYALQRPELEQSLRISLPEILAR